MTRTIQLFGDLRASREGPVVRIGDELLPIFLRQSSMDSACGPYSLLMALLALGLFHRDALIYGEGDRAHLAKQIKERARKFHFTGTRPSTLIWILAVAGKWIAYRRVSRSDIHVSVVTSLRNGELVVLGIGDSRPRLRHWVLSVGFAGYPRSNGAFHVSDLMVLDPDSEISAASAWNSTISLGKTSRGTTAWVKTEGAGNVSKVSLCAAIAVRLKRRTPDSSGK